MTDWEWSRAALKFVRENLDQEEYSVVASSGPPHMAHFASAAVGRSKKALVVLDFRDPWSLIERLPEDLDSSLWRRLSRFLEPRVVKAADLLVMNTSMATAEMKRAYPSKNVITMMNGFDDGFFAPAVKQSEVFRIAYAGDIYLDRDPTFLLKALRHVIERERLSPKDVRVEFMGDVASYAGQPLTDLARQCGVEGFVHLYRKGTRGEALEFLAQAQLLVSLPQDSHLAIPSKIFDYLRFSAWILALVKSESSTGRLLENMPADVVPPNDVEGIADVIISRLREFRRSGPPEPMARMSPDLARGAQATSFFEELDRLLEGRGANV